MRTFFSHLECSAPCTAGPYDARLVQRVCTSCGAPLLARYDLTAAKKWPKTSLPGRDASMWRYREILPLLEGHHGMDVAVTIGEGWTPLLRSRRLGRVVGLDRLFIKDESLGPGSCGIARGMSAAVTRALHLGVRAVSIPSAGHAGPALAAYAARAGLDARVFVPRNSRITFIRECERVGAVVTRVEGQIGEVAATAAADSDLHEWLDMEAWHEPYRLEGEKTIGYEIAEQLGWQLPDWIIAPAGAGLIIAGLWKAFGEMTALGWIDPVRRPHLIAVQSAGCAPLVRAFAANADKATPWEGGQTIADNLRVPSTLGDTLTLRALRESGGAALSVGDVEMVAGMKEFGQLEGLSAAPEGGAVLQALRIVMGDGRVKPHDTVVLVNAASAAPYLDLVESTRPPAAASVRRRSS